jgi:hypothetical protein
MERKWLKQTHGSCCALFALCNARRFFGLGSPEPGTPRWEELVDLACCRHGAALAIETKIAPILGLRMHRVVDKLIPPTMLTVVNPDPKGMHLHSCLYLGHTETGLWQLVNYRVGGPVLEAVLGKDLRWPDPVNGRHWNLETVRFLPDHAQFPR